MPHTESISYEHAGATYVGYLARPAPAAAPGPGVLICHEGGGLGPQVRVRAERLAQAGYVAFALDYVGGGRLLPDMPAMMALLGALRADLDRVRGLARAGLDVLRARPEVDPARIAVTGYCFGGQMALELARAGAPVAATCGFHAGLATTRPDDARQIRGPVLVCIGAEDPLISPAERLAFEAEMRAGGVDWRMLLLGGAVHGFANPHADALGNPAVRYHAPSDRRSWRAMRELFEETIDAAPLA